MTDLEAKAIMIMEIRAHGINSFNLTVLTNEQIFDIWSLVVANRNLWQHAQPHHHREIAVLIQNGRSELWV